MGRPEIPASLLFLFFASHIFFAQAVIFLLQIL